MKSSGQKRRFPPPWAIKFQEHGYDIQDSTGFRIATVYCDEALSAANLRDASRLFLTRDEARRIAKAIARLPDLLMKRSEFLSRGGGDWRWKASHPFHVALDDLYVRAHWDEIDMLCKFNSIPFDPTGEKIQHRGIWCVYEFTLQLDAIMFWDQFSGLWLHGSEFHRPSRPNRLPRMRLPPGWEKLVKQPYRG